jgi:hypothetical protein
MRLSGGHRRDQATDTQINGFVAGTKFAPALFRLQIRCVELPWYKRQCL